MSVFIELPAWYVDEVILDELGAAYFAIINRNPEPSETGVSKSTTISLDLATDSSDAPIQSGTRVYVQVQGGPELLAYDGGGTGFQTGFDGAASSTSFVDAYTLRIVIDPTSDYSSLQVVSVRVVAESSGGQTIEKTYAFTIEDLTAPGIYLATARSRTVVRIAFNESVVQTNSTDTDSALNPGNYTFSRLTAADDPSITTPSVPIEAVLIESVTSTTVDVTLDIEMTQGVEYTVVASNIEDLFGNAIEQPGGTASFVGYLTQCPDNREFNLYRMLPRKNRDEDESLDLLRFVSPFQELTDLILCSVDEWTSIFDPDIAPESFVDVILQDLGNPFNLDLDYTEKRKLIRILVPIYKQKGTKVGVINVIRFFLGIEVDVVAFLEEGWDLGVDELGDGVTEEEGIVVLGPGDQFSLYAFEVISPVALTQDQRDQITEIVELMKPAHTHFVRIVEPEIPVVIDHLELGLSELAPEEWILH